MDLFENTNTVKQQNKELASIIEKLEQIVEYGNGRTSTLFIIQEELEYFGYTFDYEADGVPYNLRKLEENLYLDKQYEIANQNFYLLTPITKNLELRSKNFRYRTNLKRVPYEMINPTSDYSSISFDSLGHREITKLPTDNINEIGFRRIDCNGDLVKLTPIWVNSINAFVLLPSAVKYKTSVARHIANVFNLASIEFSDAVLTYAKTRSIAEAKKRSKEYIVKKINNQ